MFDIEFIPQNPKVFSVEQFWEDEKTSLSENIKEEKVVQLLEEKRIKYTEFCKWNAKELFIKKGVAFECSYEHFLNEGGREKTNYFLSLLFLRGWKCYYSEEILYGTKPLEIKITIKLMNF